MLRSQPNYIEVVVVALLVVNGNIISSCGQYSVPQIPEEKMGIGMNLGYQYQYDKNPNIGMK